MSVRQLILAVLLLVNSVGAAICMAAPLPIPPVARVTDQTNTLTSDARSQLERKLYALEQSKGSQVAVLMVPTTNPEAVEQYAIRVAQSWRLGRQGVDDGVLVVIAKDDHKIRIEVGYGLEGAIPDAYSKRIVSDIMVPRFRSDDYTGGINAGVDTIAKLITGEPLPEKLAWDRERSKANGNLFIFMLISVAAVSPILASMLKPLFGAFLGSLGAGGAYFLVGFLSLPLPLAIFLGAFAFFVAFVLDATVGSGIRSGAYGSRRYGGWRGGGFGGGGGFSGGGFSGGGGRFGGGGASGSW